MSNHIPTNATELAPQSRLVVLVGCARWITSPDKTSVKGTVICGTPFILKGRSGALYECDPKTWICDHPEIT